jgi:ferredoxin
MKVVIDYDRCSGHGRCFDLSPDAFVDDENGYGQVRHDEVTPELEASVRRAVASCPEQAISVVELSEARSASDKGAHT